MIISKSLAQNVLAFRLLLKTTVRQTHEFESKIYDHLTMVIIYHCLKNENRSIKF